MSDLISRQAVENITWEEPSYTDPLNVLTEVRKKVRALPSVENKGEWIYLDECANSGYYCSICHKKLVKDGWSDTVKKIKFCPNCGADMRGE